MKSGRLFRRVSGFPEWQVGWKFALRKELMLFQKDEFVFIFERVVQVVNFLGNSWMQRKICDGWSLLFHMWLDGAVSG